MRCPECGRLDSRVLDSRPVQDHRVIKRRRECSGCGSRFTTYEKLERTPLVVIKSGGRREAFDTAKIVAGVIKACEKRPVTVEQLEELASEVERGLRQLGDNEVPSQLVGEMVMDKLKDLDEVAYVRFASVYRRFTDMDDFRRELDRLRNS